MTSATFELKMTRPSPEIEYISEHISNLHDEDWRRDFDKFLNPISFNDRGNFVVSSITESNDTLSRTALITVKDISKLPNGESTLTNPNHAELLVAYSNDLMENVFPNDPLAQRFVYFRRIYNEEVGIIINVTNVVIS